MDVRPREVAVPVRPSTVRAGRMRLDGRIACCEEGIDHPIQVARRTLESRGVLDSVAFRAVACTASIGRAVGMLDSWQRQLMDLQAFASRRAIAS